MPASEPIAVLFKERVISFETMHLGFMAEKTLPLTMAPTLVDQSKKLSAQTKSLFLDCLLAVPSLHAGQESVFHTK